MLLLRWCVDILLLTVNCAFLRNLYCSIVWLPLSVKYRKKCGLWSILNINSLTLFVLAGQYFIRKSFAICLYQQWIILKIWILCRILQLLHTKPKPALCMHIHYRFRCSNTVLSCFIHCCMVIWLLVVHCLLLACSFPSSLVYSYLRWGCCEG